MAYGGLVSGGVLKGFESAQASKREDAKLEIEKQAMGVKMDAAKRQAIMDKEKLHSDKINELTDTIILTYSGSKQSETPDPIAAVDNATAPVRKQLSEFIAFSKQQGLNVPDEASVMAKIRAARLAPTVAEQREMKAKEAGAVVGAKEKAKVAIGKDVASFQVGAKVKEISLDDPKFNEKAELIRRQGGFRIKTPGLEITTTAKDLAKMNSGVTENEMSMASVINNVEEIIDLVRSPDFVGGVAGDAISMMNSFSAQVRQMTGGGDINELVVDGKIDPTMVDLNEANIGSLRRAAIQKDRTEGAVMTLAYALAKLRDPGGRLSDTDVDLARDSLGRGADKASLISNLRDTQRRALRDYNSDARIINKRMGNKEGFIPIEELTLEGMLGGEVHGKGSVDEIVSDILSGSGL